MSLARDWRRLMARGGVIVVLALAIPITLAGLFQLGGQVGRVGSGLSAVLAGPSEIAVGAKSSRRVSRSRRALAGALATSARTGNVALSAPRIRPGTTGGGSPVGRTRGGGGGQNRGGTPGGGGGTGGGTSGGGTGGSERSAGPVETTARLLRPVTQPAVPGVTDALQTGLEETGRSVDDALSGPPALLSP